MICHHWNDSFAEGLTDAPGVFFMENLFLSYPQKLCKSVTLCLMYRCRKKKIGIWLKFLYAGDL